jgi:hypothetical protein
MSKWKERNWDKWTIGKKIRHVFAVIGSLIGSAIICLTALYVVLIVFGIAGLIEKIKETLIREIVNFLFH